MSRATWNIGRLGRFKPRLIAACTRHTSTNATPYSRSSLRASLHGFYGIKFIYIYMPPSPIYYIYIYLFWYRKMSDLVTNVIETLPSTVRFIVEFFMFDGAIGSTANRGLARLRLVTMLRRTRFDSIWIYYSRYYGWNLLSKYYCFDSQSRPVINRVLLFILSEA